MLLNTQLVQCLTGRVFYIIVICGLELVAPRFNLIPSRNHTCGYETMVAPTIAPSTKAKGIA